MSAQEYVRLPILVEAWKLTPEELPAIAKWCRGRVKGLSITFPRIRDKSKTIDSQDHNSYAVCGQYIIKTGKGFILEDGESFERKYRPATQRRS